MPESGRGGSKLLAASVLLAGAAVDIGAVFGIARLADQVAGRKVRRFDRWFAHNTMNDRQFHSPVLGPIMFFMSIAGEPRAIYPVAAAVAGRWAFQERLPDSLMLALGVLGSTSLNSTLKNMVKRPRPLLKLPPPRSGYSGSSFPSDHATMSLATYAGIAYLVARRRKQKPSRRAAAAFWAMVLFFCGLVGWSRVFRGVHNATDVLGGWLTGGIWLSACILALNTFDPTHEGNKDEGS